MRRHLVSPGCCIRIPQTGWLLKNRNLLFTILETGKSKIKASTDLVSGEGYLSGSYMIIFLRYHHMAEGIGELTGTSYKGTNPTHESSAPQDLIASQKPHKYYHIGDYVLAYGV